MFRNRYASASGQRSYIRQRYNQFNISSTLNERLKDKLDGNYWYLSYHALYIFSSNISILLENTTVRNDYITDIYDEDEEMRENENEEPWEDESEVIEDDIELESEYENTMADFNESDEDKDNEIDTSEEEDSEEEVIVDQPLKSDKMPWICPIFQEYHRIIVFLLDAKASYM